MPRIAGLAYLIVQAQQENALYAFQLRLKCYFRMLHAAVTSFERYFLPYLSAGADRLMHQRQLFTS